MTDCYIRPWFVFASAAAQRELAQAVIADKVATALIESWDGEDE